MKLEVGDIVLPQKYSVTKGIEYNSKDMDKYIGVAGSVTQLTDRGARVHGYFWPFSALTPVIYCWQIAVTPDNVEVVTSWLRIVDPFKHICLTLPAYIGYSHGSFAAQDKEFSNLPLISTQHFKKYMVGDFKYQWVQPRPSGLKIIGYKSPFQINALVDKGTLYVQNGNYGRYCPKGCVGESHSYLPKEIVETWEPEYQQSMITLNVGHPVRTLTITRENILTSCGTELKPNELRLLKSGMKIYTLSGYSVTMPEFHINGESYTVADLDKVLHAWESLQTV